MVARFALLALGRHKGMTALPLLSSAGWRPEEGSSQSHASASNLTTGLPLKDVKYPEYSLRML